MSLFLSIVTDLLFVLCIFYICNYFVILENSNLRHRYILSFAITVIFTIIVYYSPNINIDVIITTVLIVILIGICFRVSIWKNIVVSMWSYIIISLFIIITQTEVETIGGFIGVTQKDVVICVSTGLVLLFMISIKKLMYKRNRDGIKNMKIAYLVLYTVIAFVDVMAMAMLEVVTKKEIVAVNKVYYGISSFLIAVAMFIQLGAVILMMVSRDMYKEKEEEVHKYLNQQQEHYAYLEERERETKKFRHDIRLQLFVLEGMRNDNNEEYNENLEEIKERFERLRKKLSVYNDVVDAILYKFCDITDSKGIKLNVTGHMPQGCNIETYDLCAIFYNLLNNAVEALEKIDDNDKEISVDLSYIGEDIIIVVKNKFNGEMKNSNGQISTSKADKDWHGWGLQNVRDSVDKYDGIMDIDAKGNIFSVTILLKNISEEIGL